MLRLVQFSVERLLSIIVVINYNAQCSDYSVQLLYAMLAHVRTVRINLNQLSEIVY